MSASEAIRSAVAEVTQLRAQAAQDPVLRSTVAAVKAFQAARFRTTYGDLLATERFRPAVLFFLNELYSDKDYTQRDAQFVRIAGPLERLFPESVVDTAVSMAELHAITERLDAAMARALLASGPFATLDSAHYVEAWQNVGHADSRQFQLATVLRVGQDLTQFTRKRGLRTLLRMMRPAARAAGLGALQSFLEAGFDTFGAMTAQGDTAQAFLGFIAQREGALIDTLFSADVATSVQALERTDW
ncbi:hypothetical protein RQP54_02395 [Curvibacter sp. APW13]|uniref:FFLEELY motif protein n=1 Tax=Curvibacter sp. APW13 TaxID=3077236 RepID=UPI0028DE0BDE|nr:hypothetical protein [Curvibacter sp. APW13]MDT8989708.1 hypothetical protein [Curvibacter sp. APW13]